MHCSGLTQCSGLTVVLVISTWSNSIVTTSIHSCCTQTCSNDRNNRKLEQQSFSVCLHRQLECCLFWDAGMERYQPCVTTSTTRTCLGTAGLCIRAGCTATASQSGCSNQLAAILRLKQHCSSGWMECARLVTHTSCQSLGLASTPLHSSVLSCRLVYPLLDWHAQKCCWLLGWPHDAQDGRSQVCMSMLCCFEVFACGYFQCRRQTIPLGWSNMTALGSCHMVDCNKAVRQEAWCMQNGSLDGALRGQPTPERRPPPSLDWHQRTCLAAACADALCCLHSHLPQVPSSEGCLHLL